ncbi:MAG TPA: peptidoglycan-binding protein [Gammaproteobacteria bacterium]|nr:peptidoglycan-binding protein [Gammaproteobacteria bacterium]
MKLRPQLLWFLVFLPMVAIGSGDSLFKKSHLGNLDDDRYEKLSPRVRIEPLVGPIPAIPLDSISSFISSGHLVEQEDLNLSPRIISGKSDRLIFGSGDEFYASGQWQDGTSVYGIFRSGNVYEDPKSGELLGLEVIEIGLARVVDRKGDIVTLAITSAREDVRIGDLLMPTEERRVESIFYPRPPENQINGVIMNVLGGVSNVGRNDVVVINQGIDAGLEVGNVLSIAKQGEQGRHPKNEERDKMPEQRAGTLMVFRTFKKIAYGLVLRTSEPLKVGDLVRTPK